MRTVGRSLPWLSRMVNSFKPSGATRWTSTSVMLEAGGDWVFKSWIKASNPFSAPSRKISTPSSPFNTHPARVLRGPSDTQRDESQRPAPLPELGWNKHWTSLLHIHEETAALPSRSEPPCWSGSLPSTRTEDQRTHADPGPSAYST